MLLLALTLVMDAFALSSEPDVQLSTNDVEPDPACSFDYCAAYNADELADCISQTYLISGISFFGDPTGVCTTPPIFIPAGCSFDNNGCRRAEGLAICMFTCHAPAGQALSKAIDIVRYLRENY
jgi:hypothetical protein